MKFIITLILGIFLSCSLLAQRAPIVQTPLHLKKYDLAFILGYSSSIHLENYNPIDKFGLPFTLSAMIGKPMSKKFNAQFITGYSPAGIHSFSKTSEFGKITRYIRVYNLTFALRGEYRFTKRFKMYLGMQYAHILNAQSVYLFEQKDGKSNVKEFEDVSHFFDSGNQGITFGLTRFITPNLFIDLNLYVGLTNTYKNKSYYFSGYNEMLILGLGYKL